MIYTEITPNPASLKFVLQQVLLPYGSADFEKVEDTEDAPIAKKLFDFKFVERVFVSQNFITITKSEDFKWEEIIPVVKDFLKAYQITGADFLTGKYMETPDSEPMEEDEVVQKIKSLLESHVRPAIAMDGGDIVYEDFSEGTVKLRLLGSCNGCPSSTLTLKSGIEGLLTRMVPEVTAVEAV